MKIRIRDLRTSKKITQTSLALAPESSSFNSRITEYMFKLQSLTPKEIESIFIIIDGLLDNEIKR